MQRTTAHKDQYAARRFFDGCLERDIKASLNDIMILVMAFNASEKSVRVA